MTVKSNHPSANYCYTLSDQLENPVPVLEPMRSKTKTNPTMYV